MADDFVYAGGAKGKIKSAYDQTVLKTVTLGLAPFIPTFSQSYSMELKAQAGGTIEEGFFTIAPKPFTGGDKEWGSILDAYFERLENRQAGVTRESIVDTGRGLNIDKMLNPMAKELTAILDELGKYNFPDQEFGGEIGEIRLQYEMKELNRLIGMYGGDNINMGGGLSQGKIDILSGKNAVDGTTGLKVGSQMGMDVPRSKESELLFTVMQKLFNDTNIARSVGVEVTDTMVKKEIAEGITVQQDYNTALARLRENVGLSEEGAPQVAKYKTLKRINAALKGIFKNLPREARKGASTTKKLIAMYASTDKLTKEDKKTIMGMMNAPSIGGEIGSYSAGRFTIMMRQFIDRFMKMGLAALPVDFDNYSYMLPLGQTGYMANVTFGMEWSDKGYPQVVAKSLKTFSTGVTKRGIAASDLMVKWAAMTMGQNAAAEMMSFEQLQQLAVNDYYLSKSKMEHADLLLVSTMQGVLEDGATDVRIDMMKSYKGKSDKDYIGEPSALSKVLPSEMTQGLKAQFENLKKGRAGKDLSDAFKRVFGISNKATDIWKDVATKGSKDWEYKRGTNIPDQQGIWSIPPWSKGLDDPTGRGPSMTPYIASQAGPSVARVSGKLMDKVPYSAKKFTQTKERVMSFVKETGVVSAKGKQFNLATGAPRGFFMRMQR